MTAIKQFLQFYFIGVLLAFIMALLFGANFSKIVLHPALYILPAIFCITGFIIGLIMYEIKLRQQEKKRKIFFYSYCFGIIALLSVSIILGRKNIRDLNHKKQFGNIESNQDVMKYFVNDNEGYIRIAFNRLEKEFKNPNDLKLNAFSVRKQDTIINASQDTVYNIYFVYFLYPDTINKYFSEVSVLAAKPELKIYNIDTKKSDEYRKIKTEKEKLEQEAVKELNKVFKQMKDSLRKED